MDPCIKLLDYLIFHSHLHQACPLVHPIQKVSGLFDDVTLDSGYKTDYTISTSSPLATSLCVSVAFPPVLWQVAKK